MEDPWGTRIEVVQDPELLGLHRVHMRGPNPDEVFNRLLAKFGGQRTKLKGRLEGVQYRAAGFSDMWILVQRGDGEPSEGHAIDHIGWRSTGGVGSGELLSKPELCLDDGASGRLRRTPRCVLTESVLRHDPKASLAVERITYSDLSAAIGSNAAALMYSVIMVRLAVPIFATLLAMTLSAQSPPPLLQIVQERLNPDAEQAYGKIEEELARLCARMNCPNRYLALASVTLPREVWWLNGYASQADVDRVAQGYARNTALTRAMRELSQGKKGLTSEPIDMMTTLRHDLSDASPWRIGELRFAVIVETRTPVKAAGAVFQVRDGRAFVFAAASDREEADRLASVLGRDARVFEVRPQWSFPSDAWVARNPEVWKR